MNFDPLSLYSAIPQAKDYSVETQGYSDTLERDEVLEDNSGHINDDIFEPLHILDLPILRLKPPYEVLFSILRLISAEELTNFDNSDAKPFDGKVEPQRVFSEKRISHEIIEMALVWAEKHCQRFNSEQKLACLPHLAPILRLRHDAELNSYLTKILSSDLEWIEGEMRDQVRKECSLRISENCGRSAQPDSIRRIQFPDISADLLQEDILLNEPSLTSDNLGLKTWGSSYLLSKKLISQSTKYLQEPVLELGSGTGLVGMVSSRLGFDTTLTDLKDILPNLERNVQLNNSTALVKELDWTNPQSFATITIKRKFKTILISDPIYSSKHPQILVNTINEFIEQKIHSHVVLLIPIRPRFEKERSHLWSLMERNFIELESEVLQGYDDFGEMEFYFKYFVKKD